MNEYMKTGICSLILGLLGAIALQFGFVPIGGFLMFFALLVLLCGPDMFEK
jgi:hypothetical protein